jgi:hypothetical protein
VLAGSIGQRQTSPARMGSPGSVRDYEAAVSVDEQFHKVKLMAKVLQL